MPSHGDVTSRHDVVVIGAGVLRAMRLPSRAHRI
jgi:hypothetical protein